MRDPYEVLGVPRDATPDQLKAAYRAAVKATHPDHHPNDPGAPVRFREVQEAWARIRAGDVASGAEDDVVADVGPDELLNLFERVFGRPPETAAEVFRRAMEGVRLRVTRRPTGLGPD